MKRESIWTAGIFCLLVLLAAIGRWLGASDHWAALPPNFTPVAAVGLFAGFLFASRTLALAVPLAALALSDFWLPSHDSPLVMLAVYGSMMAAPLFGRWLRSRPSLAKAGICILAPSIFFYLTTNLAEWFADMQHVERMYATTWSGLLACYAAGIPFFRWMVEGDLIFCGALFGAYGMVMALQGRRQMELSGSGAQSSLVTSRVSGR